MGIECFKYRLYLLKPADFTANKIKYYDTNMFKCTCHCNSIELISHCTCKQDFIIYSLLLILGNENLVRMYSITSRILLTHFKYLFVNIYIHHNYLNIYY